MALGAGILAGLISWLLGEVSLNAFRPPLETQHVMGQVIMKARFEDQSAADFKNAILAFGVLGGVLGLVLGMAGGLARKSTRAGVRAAAAGLVLGSLMGVGASLVLLPVYFRALDREQEELSRDLILPLMVHGGIWAATGLAGGLAFGIGLEVGRTRIVNAGLGGLIGAALGAALYIVIGAAAFPGYTTTSPLSVTWETRLLARLLVATLAAVIAATAVNRPIRRPAGPHRTP